MTIPAIGPVATPVVAPARPAEPAATTGGGFAEKLGEGLAHLQQRHDTANDLAVKASSGDLTDIHDYMIASTEASLATKLTVAVRNKAVEAFTEIMRMQA